MDSILTSIKKLLGIEADYKHFDQDIIIHVNSVLFILRQAGVGSDKPFSIKGDEETWSDFLGDELEELEAVKTYVFMKVKLIFDPPLSSSVMEAYKSFISEFEWRLNVESDEYEEEEIQNGE